MKALFDQRVEDEEGYPKHLKTYLKKILADERIIRCAAIC